MYMNLRSWAALAATAAISNVLAVATPPAPATGLDAVTNSRVVADTGPMSEAAIAALRQGTSPNVDILCDIGLPFMPICMDNFGSVNQSDANALLNWLRSTPRDYAPVSRRSWYSWTTRTARLCIYNDFIYVDKEVTNQVSADALAILMAECCKTSANCLGGTFNAVPTASVTFELVPTTRAC